jgi:hypothetical protein
MDILTAKGKISVEDEQATRRLWESYYPDYRYIETPKEKPAAFDAVLVKGKNIYAVVETKCRRDMTLEKFNTEYKAQWLVTYNKIRDCCTASDLMGVPFIGFLYVQPSNTLLVKEIYRDGQFQQHITIQQTRTQATTNGGNVLRDNAYINMAQAKVLQGDV